MDQVEYYNQNSQNANVTNNRVYINRNFNRTGIESVPTLLNSKTMYLNPNFSHTERLNSNIIPQNHQANRTKIYVNPNFIKPKSQNCSFDIGSHINTVSSPSLSTNSLNLFPSTWQEQAANVHSLNNKANISKSRYCLVRQEEIKVTKPPLVKAFPNKNIQQTVKVNKYKSVSLNTVKQTLAIDKNSISKTVEFTSNEPKLFNFKSKYRIGSKPLASSNVQNTRFKYVKRNSLTSLVNSLETKQGTVKRVSVTLNKSILKSSFREHKKVAKGAMKKNNIPCPLFKKYGQCLRMARGSCNYLHDKKHVSVCRKFLKGICHDEQCFLSHDLTDKKMPTCYFYLQGICTKDGCPYLHVKLNDQTKVCQDFLKGYCEKGDKCLCRHIDPHKAFKNVRSKKQKSCIQVNQTTHTQKLKKYAVHKRVNKVSVKGTENPNQKESGQDHRYFRDVTDDTSVVEQCDLIKPTRCKLGTLPSFIQL